MDPDISIDQEGVERCQEQNLDRSKRYRQLTTSMYRERFRVSIEQIENSEKMTQWIGICIERYLEKP